MYVVVGSTDLIAYKFEYVAGDDHDKQLSTNSK